MRISDYVPTYWGSWKGRIVKAIAIDRAFTWAELKELTGLSTRSLNHALSELIDEKAITKNEEGEYRVSVELYKEYRKFFDDISNKKVERSHRP